MTSRDLTLTTTLRVQYHPDQDLVALEQTIAAEGRRAARDLYQELARILDAAPEQASAGVDGLSSSSLSGTAKKHAAASRMRRLCREDRP